MHRCFIESSWIDQFIENPLIALPEDVLHRLLKVVRLKPGEVFALFDGQGRQITAMLAKNGLSSASLEHALPPKSSITVLQALIEESKITETLKRGTEFGADHFVLFNAEKSEPFLGQKLQRRKDRLERVLIDAARQSERLFVPSLSLVSDVGEALSLREAPFWGIYGNPQEERLLSTLLKEKAPHDRDFLVAIGPEGGFSSSELAIFMKHKLVGVRFAPYTLRTELAAIGALTLINASLGRA